jgi:protein TonB
MQAELHDIPELQSGQSLTPGDKARRRWFAASVALHAVLLGALVYSRPPKLAPVGMPGEKNGHRLLLTYSPGMSAPASALQAPKHAIAAPPSSHALEAPKPTPVPTPAATASASTDAASGADALGDGDTTVALVVVHPPPRPDLSKLPSGTRGDVIVDVVIDKTGHIAKFTMTRGLGHGVDDTVLATIQQWTFQPATRNGVPVASEQELLFHYERG